VDAAARRARLRPLLPPPPDDGGPTRLEPEAGGVDAALGRIVAAVHAAIAEGTWPRLKACERRSCSWAFYDRSKNRSGHWCSMAGCGAREKSRRAYRRRRARES
jgi:predicted RNA-binding Zn ribbon-like protein